MKDNFKSFLKSINTITRVEVLMGIPSINHGVYLQWKGNIDTQYQFSDFFANDHTVMAWFMPQYVFGQEGAILGENGFGQYRIGPGDYRDIRSIKLGNPVLRIRIGNLTSMYLVPDFGKNVWHHLAIRRSQGTISLYLDGSKQDPVEKVGTNIQPANEIVLNFYYT